MPGKLDKNVADALHEGLAAQLLARLTAGECATCKRSAASHQELTAVRQFLSDNGVTGMENAGRLRALTDEMPFVAEEDRPVEDRKVG